MESIIGYDAWKTESKEDEELRKTIEWMFWHPLKKGDKK